VPGREPPLPHVPIDSVVDRIDQVSTLPHVALHVMEVANNLDAGAAELKLAVEGDPALSARVLHCVNSSAHPLRAKITNLHSAISYLGFAQVRNLAITASVSDIFKHDEVIGPYSRTELWRHLVSVGVCGRLIAMRKGLPNFEDAFLGGLMHDFGIILEDQHVHRPFRLAIQSLRSDETLVQTEQEYLGFDHTTLGSRIAETWKFPPSVRACIRFHHMSGNCRTPEMDIVHCVAVANLICTLKGISSVGMKLVELPQDALSALSFNKEDIRVLAGDLDRELSQHKSLFCI
jgi:HD-like signal output (HDOD) protein